MSKTTSGFTAGELYDIDRAILAARELAAIRSVPPEPELLAYLDRLKKLREKVARMFGENQ